MKLKCARSNHCSGQVARYMEQQNLHFGVLSNYDHTIFLRQYVQNFQRELDVSPPIKSRYPSDLVTEETDIYGVVGDIFSPTYFI